MLGASLRLGLRPALRASKIVPDDFVVHRVEQPFALANHLPVIRPSGQPTAVQNRSRRFCADQLEAKLASAKTHIDHLTQSTLAKAFARLFAAGLAEQIAVHPSVPAL